MCQTAIAPSDHCRTNVRDSLVVITRANTLDSGVVPFYNPGTPWQRDRGSHGCHVLAESGSEAHQRTQARASDFGQPRLERCLTLSSTHQFGKTADQSTSCTQIRTAFHQAFKNCAVRSDQMIRVAQQEASDRARSELTLRLVRSLALAQPGQVASHRPGAAAIPQCADLAAQHGAILAPLLPASIEVLVKRAQECRAGVRTTRADCLWTAGVSELAHRLPIQVQVFGNRVDGLPARYQRLNLLISALVPLQQGAAGRWSWRRVGQRCQTER